MEREGFSVQAGGRRPPLSPISKVPWADDDDDTDDVEEDAVLLGGAINSSPGNYSALSTSSVLRPTHRSPLQHSPRARQGAKAMAQSSPERTPTKFSTCDECNGKGLVQSPNSRRSRKPSTLNTSVDSGAQDLVTLVSASDARLKPRRTKLIVSMWVVLTLAVGAIVAYVLWPRSVNVAAPLEFSFSNFTGWTNCPPLPTNRACVDQSCATTNWPDLPYCNTDNQSTFNASICNSIKGCTYQGTEGRVNSTYQDCWTCNDPKMQVQHICEAAQSDDAQMNCVWRDGLCDSSQIGPIGFVFNYTFSVSNMNYLPAMVENGYADVSFTDITDDGEEQQIVVFNGQFSSISIPARSTSTLVLPVNVTIAEVNFTNTQPHDKLKLVPIESLKRVVLHDVCAKTAGKCGKDVGGGDLPERNQFFVTFRMNLTVSTGPAKTDLNQDGIIALRRHCPIINASNTTTTSTASTLTISDDSGGVAKSIGGAPQVLQWRSQV